MAKKIGFNTKLQEQFSKAGKDLQVGTRELRGLSDELKKEIEDKFATGK